MKSVLKKFQPYLMALAIGVIIYILWQADFSGIILALCSLPLTLVLLLILLQVVTQLLLNFQWYRLSKVMGWETSFFKLLVVNSYGVVADAITPGEKVGGEVARVVQLNRKFGYTTGQSTILVTIQKALSLSSLVVLNLLVVLTMSDNINFLRPIPVRVLIFGVLLIVAVFLFFLLFKTDTLNTQVARIKTNKDWLKKFVYWVDSFTQHTQIIRRKKGEWVFQLILSLLIWSVFPIKLILLVLPYTKDIPVFALLGTTFVSYFAGMIPLLPGGIGTFEASMGGILTAYGLGINEGAAVTVVFRFITFWLVVLISSIIILAEKLLKLKAYHKNYSQ